MAKRDLALDLFRSFQSEKKFRKKTVRDSHAPTGEPQLLSDLLSALVDEREWRTGIAEGTLFLNWEQVLGPQIFEHASPISLLDGILTIKTTSTAWATQLKLVAPDILATIQKSAPGALVESLSIIGPNGPSWKKGLRTIRGARGPRDTYG